ncbi:MAG: DUF952 domain-containing protein [Chitinophagaceae bacterium]|nr:DUF952 domain-containing protein [Chitinophagaceae bacterium]
MEPTFIYHIARYNDWHKAAATGLYVPSAFEQEGFIHCATNEQVNNVLDRYFKGQTVLKLTIDVSLLVHPPKYEWAASVNQLFPHIYGPVNLDAVIATLAIG